MRVDSCRNCGNNLAVKGLCDECDQPLRIQCAHCNKFVDNPIHFHPKVFSQNNITGHQIF